MTGHMMGAAGAFEAFVCARVVQTGCIPPTINYRHPDPELTLDYVPNEARQTDSRVALSNSMGLGRPQQHADPGPGRGVSATR